MLRKEIKYTDLFSNEEVTVAHYFHLSKAELVELEMSHKGGLAASLQVIIESGDNAKIIQEFKNIILAAYGERSVDGRFFRKNEQVREEFLATEAYSALFMELVTDTDAAVEFVNGIIPAELSAEAARLAGIDPAVTPLIVMEKPREVYPHEINEFDREGLDQLALDIAAGRAVLMPAVPASTAE